MSTVLDLFIQDFVSTNKLLNQRWSWEALCSRRLQEAGPTKKVFEFTSGGGTTKHLAVGQWLGLPDGDWFRIELTHPLSALPADPTEHRFDCLRMMYAHTHRNMSVEVTGGGDTVIIKLTTGHRGLMNLVFVVRGGAAPVENPFLVI